MSESEQRSENFWNIKERLVICESCKYEEETDKPNPICPKCKRKMLTVTFNSITGERRV